TLCATIRCCRCRIPQNLQPGISAARKAAPKKTPWKTTAATSSPDPVGSKPEVAVQETVVGKIIFFARPAVHRPVAVGERKAERTPVEITETVGIVRVPGQLTISHVRK